MTTTTTNNTNTNIIIVQKVKALKQTMFTQPQKIIYCW